MTEQTAVTQLGHGLYLEDFAIGRKFISAGRTITEADFCAFINLTHMTEAVFIDVEYAKVESVMKGRAVPAALCYAFSEGLCIVETVQFTGLAFLNMELDVKAPTFVGDTIHVELEVTEARVSKSNPTRGLVRTRNTVIKQDGSVVLVYTPMRMVKCRGN